MRTFKVLIDGLAFAEEPRWRDGKLFFSDMHAHQVLAVDMAGRRELICEVPERLRDSGWDAGIRRVDRYSHFRRTVNSSQEGLRSSKLLGAMDVLRFSSSYSARLHFRVID